jgi:hypothetical protein
MLDTLITSKTRIKLLLRFFLNSNSTSYLRNLETEFNESTNSIRIELNRFEKAGLLVSGMKGNRKIFQANTRHPLFPDITSIIRKYVGYDKIIDNITTKLGSLKKAYITGDLALGKDTREIDLLLIGRELDTEYLDKLIRKTENLIHRNIHYTILDEFENPDKSKAVFLIWDSDGNF